MAMTIVEGAIVELSEAYRRLDEAEQDEVNDVVIEWVLSDDESLRYDALFLVSEYQPPTRASRAGTSRSS